MSDARLVVRRLDKSFAAPVLQQVDFSVQPGEVHAIVGENGAGKSTLVNLLAGILPKDAGEFFLDGEGYEPRCPVDSFKAGISFAAQELSVIGTLTVAENIALRDLPHRHAVIAKERLQRQAERMLRLVGLDDIAPDTMAEHLSLAERQLLELAKALAMDSRLLILDEPTAALAAPQAERIHAIIEERAGSGASVIYISHRLHDVLNVADTITVLRDGRVVASMPAATMSVDAMMEHMTGRHSQPGSSSRSTLEAGTPALTAESLVTDELPHGVSLTCHHGEILGIAGLAGAGKSELMHALFGLAHLKGGRLGRLSDDMDVPITNAGDAVRNGIGLLAEDRQSMGIYPGQSVLSNMMLPGRYKTTPGIALIKRANELTSGNELRKTLDIRCGGLQQDIRELSGGNQQKALIARWLQCESDVLLLDEPTRGVDIGTKNTIYDLLFELRSRGKAIVVASSEIEELMTVCSRIIVLSNRELVREFQRGDWSETAILTAAFQAFTGNGVGHERPRNVH